MQKSKLADALRTCNASELERFRSFIRSPYFNDRKELRSLLDFLLAFHPGFSAPDLTKERAFEVVFPGRTYEDKEMRYLMSDLTKLIEHFWVVEKQRSLSREQELVLLDVLSERRLERITGR